MAPERFADVKSALDKALGAGPGVNIGMGSDLLTEMRNRSLLPFGKFLNSAYPLGIGPEYFDMEAYQGRHPVFEGKDLPGDAFFVGMGGRDA